MVLQKSKEASAISQWVFYRAAQIGPVETGEDPQPDLKIAVAFDQSGRITKAIVTPFDALPEGLEEASGEAGKA